MNMRSYSRFDDKRWDPMEDKRYAVFIKEVRTKHENAGRWRDGSLISAPRVWKFLATVSPTTSSI